MPVIVFKNGKREGVTYDKASRLNDVLEGRIDEKTTATQIAYCKQVDRVEFDPPRLTNRFKTTNLPEPDPVIHELMEDPTLHGYDKFMAIGMRLQQKLSI